MSPLGVRFGKDCSHQRAGDIPRDLLHGATSRHDLACSLELRDLSTSASGRRCAFAGELLNVALTMRPHNFAIPRGEARMRLACAWPLLIGLRTLDLLAKTPNWLDPTVRLKVPRLSVYGLMARSLGTVWSTRALGRQARRLRARITL
jgi:farnesyl-diphosphate farnesyltransferase